MIPLQAHHEPRTAPRTSQDHHPGVNPEGTFPHGCSTGSLVEGDTTLCMLGPDGALFQTQYHAHVRSKPILRVLWLNVDATGYMNVNRGDRILEVDHL
jgi:hypothetical protein